MSTDTLALLIVILILGLFSVGSIAALILFMSRDTTKIPEIVARITNVESLVEKLSADVGAEMSNPYEIWKTADGKYEATSFEELLTKMAEDPNSPLSRDEIESIQSIFDKIMGAPDDDDGKWKESE